MSISISVKFSQEAVKPLSNIACLRETCAFTHVLEYLYYFQSISNDYEGLSLHISGFDGDPWPLEDSTELIIFLEQLPGVLLDARQRRPFKIEFYEQGFERELIFSPQRDTYKIDYFESHGSEDISGTEELTFLETVQMLEECLSAFKLFAQQFFDALEEQTVISHWYRTGQLCEA